MYLAHMRDNSTKLREKLFKVHKKAAKRASKALPLCCFPVTFCKSCLNFADSALLYYHLSISFRLFNSTQGL